MKKQSFFSFILILLAYYGNTQVYLMDNTPVSTCSGVFYDSGGAGSNYQNNETYTKTFSPAVPGQKIRADFTVFNIEGFYDNLTIYNGPDNTYPVIGSFDGTNSPATIISSAPGGELTFEFNSDYSVTLSGWVANISCVLPPAPPSNDDVCSASSLTVGAPGVYNYVTYTLTGATNASDYANCDNNNAYPHDVWFSLVVPASGRLDVRTQDLSFTDGAIALYTGTNCNTLTELICSGTGSGSNDNMGRILQTGLTPGSTVYIRAWRNGGGYGDFQIAAADFIPFIDVQFPNGGEKLVVDETYFINWYSEGVDYVDIEYSINNGTNWNVIATNVYALNFSQYWLVPNTISSQCLIRITETGNPSLQDLSNTTFEIVYPYIELTTPNGGEIYTVNQYTDIEWDSYGNIPTILSLEISLNGGTSWTNIQSGFSNFNNLSVNMPATPSNNCLIRITGLSSYGTTTVTSAQVFSILTYEPEITIHTPYLNAQYDIRQGVLITWEADPIINTVDIQTDGLPGLVLNDDDTETMTDTERGGPYWSTIASNVPANSGYYYWATDGITSSGIYKIRILPSNSPWLAKESDYFNLYYDTIINIIYPGYSGETWYGGTYKTLSWEAYGTTAVNVEYSLTGPTGTFMPIVTNYTNNQYYWHIPNTPSTDVYIRVTDAANPAISALSAYASTILDPGTITNTTNLIYSGSLNICPGAEFDVDYTATGSYGFNNTFDVQLSDAAGSFANPVSIGSLWGYNLSGTITVKIPEYTSNGNSYRMRVVSDDMPANPTDNGQNLTIAKPDADFTASSNFKYLPDGQVDFTFTGNPSGITAYNWKFGNGVTSNIQNPTYNYTAKGYYTVSLTTTAGSCSSTLKKQAYISVEDLFNNDTINVPVSGDYLSVRFLDGVKGCIGLDNGNCLITLDSGLTWQNTPTGLSTKITSVSIVPGFWLVTSDAGMVSYSTNGGVTWTAVNIGTTENLRGSAFKTAANGYVVGENSTIFKYDGNTWTQETTPSVDHINGIAFSDDDVIAVGNNGLILRSVTGNGTWTQISAPYNSDLNAVTFNSNLTGIAAGQYGRIIRSSDGGQTWSPVLPAAYTWFKSVEMNVDSAWAVGTNGIIYESMDEGLTWVRNGIGTPNNLNNIVFYGSEQRSILQANNPDYIFERAQAPNRGYIVGNQGTARLFGEPIVDTTNAVNNIFNFNVLFQVYPNPASDRINISSELKNQSHVIISVKDVFGRAIQNISIPAGAGVFKKQLDISKLSNGYYFIDITLGQHQEIHRFVISK